MNLVFDTSPDILILCALEQVHGLGQASYIISVQMLYSLNQVIFIMSYQLIDFINCIVSINTKFSRFVRSKRKEKFCQILCSLAFTLGAYQLFLLIDHDCLEFEIKVL